jgi:excinuclease ABC subunit B
VNGRVILYADNITDSMFAAISETNRRREIQMAYNEKNHITPRTIIKEVRDVLETIEEFSDEEGLDADKVEGILLDKPADLNQAELNKLSRRLEKEMKEAARSLNFEEAARLRDLLVVVRGRIK